MSDEREAQTIALLVKKLLASEKLTKAENDLLVSSPTILIAVFRELAFAKRASKRPRRTPVEGNSPDLPRSQGASQALQHGKAVLEREFPGIFEDTV